MNNQEEKIYCGSGKMIGRFGNIACGICIDDIEPLVKVAKNGKRYMNFIVCAKKQVDQYGNSHYLVVDTYKKDEMQQQVNNHQEETLEYPVDDDINPEDIPF